MQRKRLLIIIGAALAGLALLVLLFFLGGQGDRVRVEIIVTPTDSTLTVDGVRTEPGTVSLTRGKHTLKASRQYFGDVTKEIDTETLDTSQPIYLLPDPNTPEAEKFFAENDYEQMLRERAFSQKFSNTQESILERYPIVNNLPYKTIDYEINYEVTEDKNVKFTVTLYPVATEPGTDLYKEQLNRYKDSALKYMHDNGVDTDSADITFSPNPDE